MSAPKKSYDLDVAIPDNLEPKRVAAAVERASKAAGVFISHIGGYSRKKYPNSVHWHFKRNKKEKGVIDATYWDVGNRLWLMIRYAEPEWVHDVAPRLRAELEKQLQAPA